MGLSKAQYIDLIRDNLASDSAELRSRWHPRIVEKYLDIAFDSVLNKNKTVREGLMDEMGMDLWKYAALTKPFYLDFKYDEKRKRYYSELPINILSITNNNGIQMICPVEEEQSAFLPTGVNDLFLFSGLDVGQLSGLIYFTLEGNRRIYYSGDINGCWKEVLAKLVLSFSEFDDNDDIDIPNGLNAEIIQMTLMFMKGKLPEDIVDDSNAMQTTA